jgi:hypothetical protein
MSGTAPVKKRKARKAAFSLETETEPNTFSDVKRRAADVGPSVMKPSSKKRPNNNINNTGAATMSSQDRSRQTNDEVTSASGSFEEGQRFQTKPNAVEAHHQISSLSSSSNLVGGVLEHHGETIRAARTPGQYQTTNQFPFHQLLTTGNIPNNSSMVPYHQGGGLGGSIPMIPNNAESSIQVQHQLVRQRLLMANRIVSGNDQSLANSILGQTTRTASTQDYSSASAPSLSDSYLDASLLGAALRARGVDFSAMPLLQQQQYQKHRLAELSLFQRRHFPPSAMSAATHSGNNNISSHNHQLNHLRHLLGGGGSIADSSSLIFNNRRPFTEAEAMVLRNQLPRILPYSSITPSDWSISRMMLPNRAPASASAAASSLQQQHQQQPQQQPQQQYCGRLLLDESSARSAASITTDKKSSSESTFLGKKARLETSSATTITETTTSSMLAPSSKISNPDYQSSHNNQSNNNSLILYTTSDNMCLSQFQCLARQQIELFEATEQDVDAGARGRNTPIVVGQVGIRCIHCAHLTNPLSKGRAAVYFPTKLDRVYQTAVNMATIHFCGPSQHCEFIPFRIRDLLIRLREQKSTSAGGKSYVASTIRLMGVVEEKEMLRFAASSTSSTTITTAPEPASEPASKPAPGPAPEPAANTTAATNATAATDLK